MIYINGQHIQNFLLCKTKTNKIFVDYSVTMWTRLTKEKITHLAQKNPRKLDLITREIVPYDKEAELQKMKVTWRKLPSRDQ